MPSPIINYEARPRRHSWQSIPPPPPQTGIQDIRATTDGYIDNSTFSDGSHNLRRSLNVAQNLSRLAEGVRQPLGPPPPHQQQAQSWLNISRSAVNSPSGSYHAMQPSYHPRQSLHTTQTPIYSPRSQPSEPPRHIQGPVQREQRSYVEPEEVSSQSQRPAFLSQPVYQLACAACIRPLCLRAMKAVMLSDHSKELYSTDMPPAGLQLVNDDRQVRHCACRIRDSACLGWYVFMTTPMRSLYLNSRIKKADEGDFFLISLAVRLLDTMLPSHAPTASRTKTTVIFGCFIPLRFTITSAIMAVRLFYQKKKKLRT